MTWKTIAVVGAGWFALSLVVSVIVGKAIALGDEDVAETLREAA